MFNQSTIEKILNGKFRINFFDGVLTKEASNIPCVGNITQDLSKKILLETYSKSEELEKPTHYYFFKDNSHSIISGQILPEHTYFTFRANYSSFNICAENILKTPSTTQEGLFFLANINEIAFEQKCSITNKSITVFLDYALDIPFNEWIKENNYEKLSQFKYKIQNLLISIKIIDEQFTEIHISNEGSINFEEKANVFLEALEIFIGEKINPLCQFNNMFDKQQVKIYSKQERIKATTHIFAHKHPMELENFKHFISSYLKNIKKHDHYIYQTWKKIIHHDQSFIDVRALNYTVGIEQLLNLYYINQYITEK